MNSITVIVPTIPERDPAATIVSTTSQLLKRDNIVVAIDTARKGNYGHPVRNDILDHKTIKTDYICSIDDDDVHTPNALETMRNTIEEHPGRWFIFQMQGGANSHFPNRIIPSIGHRVYRGNIGTPMLLWPNGSRSRFGHNYMGDYLMALDLREELGEPVWVDTVTAIVRP